MPCKRGAVDHHVETLACQTSSKQMAGKRKRASTRFRASLARMEMAMAVYILHGHTSAGRAHGVKHGECEEEKCAQASKQGSRVEMYGSDGYTGQD